MDHQLENLGPERFQQLSQALLVKEFPGIICLPVGQPDGGRDALRYVTNVADPRFTVYQVKYSRTPRDGGNARKWVLETSDNEVEKIGRLIEKRSQSICICYKRPRNIA